eukprot:CAMPEP_0198253534 /NCGR_PEP_ID=MMETSP1447-20131203/3943_1 /TAXON_ID=420782 /ORGANISM="Chaetoceros dichaeta, Strain CCMP1751" /LENGTH=150 /DNA_ID=CAMNT_0043939243 /DNA_START=158 /DNA_END=613 /DNA_ORIENTATION=+
MVLRPTSPYDDYEKNAPRRRSLTSMSGTILARKFSEGTNSTNSKDIEMRERKITLGARDNEKQQMLLVRAAESTRQRKELSSKQMTNPETIAGMKGTKLVELEVAAKNKTATMLNEDEYRYDICAGIAAFSRDEIEPNRRKPSTKLEPFT